jgi:8-oxo-dGTP pyrophosphatase MutT (NUDIX family)
MDAALLIRDLGVHIDKYGYGKSNYDYVITLTDMNMLDIYNIVTKDLKKFKSFITKFLVVFIIKVELSQDWLALFESYDIIQHEMEYKGITIYVYKEKQDMLIVLSEAEDGRIIRKHACIVPIYMRPNKNGPPIKQTILARGSVATSKFLLISGSVEPYEADEDCMVRELREETGLVIEKERLEKLYEFEKPGKIKLFGIKYVDVFCVYNIELVKADIDFLKFPFSNILLYTSGELRYLLIVDVAKINKDYMARDSKIDDIVIDHFKINTKQ